LCSPAYAFVDLHQDAAAVQAQLLSITKLVVLLPVRIADEVTTVIVDHDPVVICVELESAILPPLLLALEIVCV